MNIQEIKSFLNHLITDIQTKAPSAIEEDLRLWLMSVALKIWASNRIFSKDYMEVIPVIKEGNYTALQVMTALDCLGEEPREMNTPSFFKEIVSRD